MKIVVRKLKNNKFPVKGGFKIAQKMMRNIGDRYIRRKEELKFGQNRK